MGTVYDIRYANLQLLVEQEGGLNNGGLARVAEKLGKSQGQLSHIGGASPIKNIGDKVARDVERAYGKPKGWMDTPQRSGGGDAVRESATVYSLPSQPAGPSIENMHLAVDVARYWIDLHGLHGAVEDHIPLLATAHDLVLEVRASGAPGSVLDLSKKLAARLREESGNGDERGSSAGPGGKGVGVRGKPTRGRSQ